MAKDWVFAHYTAVAPEVIKAILSQGGRGELIQGTPWKQATEHLKMADRTKSRLPLLVRSEGAAIGVQWWADIDDIRSRRGAGTVVSIAGFHLLPRAIPLSRLERIYGGSLADGRLRGNEPCFVSRRALGPAPRRTPVPALLPSDKPDARSAAIAEVDADPATRAVGPTTRERLIDARLGQGLYRTRLMKIWGRKCALTGCSVVRLLVASHAKKWSLSTNEERLDAFNGLLLSASADKLFDVGLISFASNGKLLVSPSVTPADLATQGLRMGMKLSRIETRHLPYFEAHRKAHGFT